MFKFYTQNNCTNCEEMKAFLKVNGLSYEEVDVNEDTKARAFMIMNDLETTPAIQTDNDIICGDIDFMKGKITSLL